MKKQRLILVPMLLLLFVLLFAFGVSAATENTAESNVYVTVEKLVLGQGYIIEPTAVPYEDGMTAATALLAVLDEDAYQYTGSVDGRDFYISFIKDEDMGFVEMPKILYDAVVADQGYISARSDSAWLGEFDYYHQSGWMLTVNHAFIDRSCADYELSPGDVIRWQYTVYGYGSDLGNGGSAWGGSDALIKAANKDTLIQLVANASDTESNAYQNAYSVLLNPLATQEAVDIAKANLETNAEIDLVPSSFETQTTTFAKKILLNLSGEQIAPGETLSLKATVLPENTTFGGITWKSSNRKVATVSDDGVVTALTEGTANITATTADSGASALCKVTVKESSVTVMLPFNDVFENQWFYPHVHYVYANKIMNGKTETIFAPDEAITRGQFIAILGRYAQVKDSSMENPCDNVKFEDVDANDYYASHIAWAHEKGIVEGISEKEFAPAKKITREQMATMMFRYAKAMGTEETLPSVDGSLFVDDSSISDYAREGVYRMKAAGILEGEGNNLFHPKGNTTRGAAAKTIHIFMEL